MKICNLVVFELIEPVRFSSLVTIASVVVPITEISIFTFRSYNT